MNLRQKKKKGLLRGPSNRQLKALVKWEIEEESRLLEERCKNVKLPEEL